MIYFLVSSSSSWCCVVLVILVILGKEIARGGRYLGVLLVDLVGWWT